MTVIDYYFSPVSPFTYLGHQRFGAIAGKHGATVRLKPIDLGRIFPVSGGLPVPKRAPQRQAYRLVELKRWSTRLDLPLNLHPKHFPAPDALASHMIIAADRDGADAFGLAGAFMRAVWAEEQNIADRDAAVAIADACGLDGGALAARAEQPDIAAQRDAFTDEAIEAQVFGAPTYALDGELFWGQDRLDLLDEALAARG